MMSSLYARFCTILFCIACTLLCLPAFAAWKADPSVQTGAARMSEYLPLLQGKKVGLVINQTSVVNSSLLLDTLLSEGVTVLKVFVPEHGFRGKADAGAHINNETDPNTGIPVISLYGNNKKPVRGQLEELDVLIYDLQDVGVRFYTYISTLQYVMEACAENHKQLIILDRPNPNGHLVDGPILDTALRSFVGMQPVPVLYGMTPGEYARMLVGEQWIKKASDLDLKVIACTRYTHRTQYELPVAPSPNLRNMTAIYLYPGLCLFEGTIVSVGRGTEKPFQQWGHPDFATMSRYSFTPKSMSGASKPPFEGQACYGMLVADDAGTAFQLTEKGISLEYLVKAYLWSPQKDKFFTPFFEKLAGTKKLREQIIQGMSADAIRASWQRDLEQFRKIRKKYLIYED